MLQLRKKQSAKHQHSNFVCRVIRLQRLKQLLVQTVPLIFHRLIQCSSLNQLDSLAVISRMHQCSSIRRLEQRMLFSCGMTKAQNFLKNLQARILARRSQSFSMVSQSQLQLFSLQSAGDRQSSLVILLQLKQRHLRHLSHTALFLYQSSSFQANSLVHPLVQLRSRTAFMQV